MNWQASDLIAFEKRVYDAFAAKQCKGPVHLSGGNEDQLIEIFKNISRDDYLFSNYRSHYHALLHGIDPDWLFREIIEGRSMNIMSPEHRFFTSAIVGGCLPIAVGVAAALKRQGGDRKVWCFVGDMCATTGAFHEARSYAELQDLPITFVIESNWMSCDSPTEDVWGDRMCGWFMAQDEIGDKAKTYFYKRIYPHTGIGRNVF